MSVAMRSIVLELAAPPADCRDKRSDQCFTLNVADVKARLRPLLHIDPERPR